MLVHQNVGRLEKLGVVIGKHGRGLDFTFQIITVCFITLPLVIPRIKNGEITIKAAIYTSSMAAR